MCKAAYILSYTLLKARPTLGGKYCIYYYEAEVPWETVLGRLELSFIRYKTLELKHEVHYHNSALTASCDSKWYAVCLA